MIKEIEIIRSGKKDITVSSNKVFSYPIHTHSYYEMTLYMPFDGCIKINGKTYIPSAPMISLISPSDLHVIEVLDGGNSEFIKIGFGVEMLDNSLRASASAVLKNVEESDGIIGIFKEILKKGDCKYSAFLINAVVTDIIQRGEIIKSAEFLGPFSYLAVAIAKINAEFNKELTLRSVASELGITPQYLSHIFRKSVGEGFAEYLIRIRLERAGIYLKETDLSVTDIAYEVGYKDLSHFMRSFKRFFGKSPLSYRKNKT